MTVPGSQRRLFATQHLAAGDFDVVPVVSSAVRVSSSSRETDAIDGKRLAAKTQRRDGEQVVYVAQLAGGMPLEGQHAHRRAASRSRCR